MTDTAVAFLGAIALSTVVMAAIQVGMVIYGVRLARRTEQLVTRVERDVAPIVERLTAMSQDASRAAAMAVVQVEKVDRLVTDISHKVDQTLTTAQKVLVAPAKEGAALAAALRATVGTFRELRRQRRPGADDDDALFIG